MALNTVIRQGQFVADGLDKIIGLGFSPDWVEVYNQSNLVGAVQWAGVYWSWQKGMPNDDAIVYYHAGATQALSMSSVAAGFNGEAYRGVDIIDSTLKTPGPAIVVTAGTNAVQPVYATANTGRLVSSSIVRIQNTAHTTLNGLDFSVDTVNNDVNFRLRNAIGTAQGVVAGANGTWRYIAPNEDVYNMFNPKKRVIANITQANPGVVTTLVNHTYQTGQVVRLSVPQYFGMRELDGKLVTVTRINRGTFSIDVDTTGYGAFTFVTPAIATRFTPAQVTPVGEALGSNTRFEGAQENTAFKGIILGTSDAAAIALGSPGGSVGQTINWRVGGSFDSDVTV